jgi:beta-glucosidase/6-phospho-beta-glucosidase/beta-galactosidase
MSKDPLKRLGVKNKEEIKNHPFFNNFDWGKLLRKEIQPPFEKIQITEKMIKQDLNLKFEDQDYSQSNYYENRVPDFSFAVNLLEK